MSPWPVSTRKALQFVRTLRAGVFAKSALMTNSSDDELAALNALQRLLLALSNLGCSCGCLLLSVPLLLFFLLLLFGFIGALL